MSRQSLQPMQQMLEAREEERKQVARELHDHLIQALVGLHYQVADMRAHPGPDIDARLAQLQHDLQLLLDDVRRICTNLRPPALEQQGLAAVVQSYVRALQCQVPFHVVLLIDGDKEQPLHADTGLCIFRVLQEALANVRKHADAELVVVRLQICPDEVSLMVRDDGAGFSVPHHFDALPMHGHFGLRGMRERLDLVHGALEVRSALGQGTSIYVCVPNPCSVRRATIQGEEVFYD